MLGNFCHDYRSLGVYVTITIGEGCRESEDRICWEVYVLIIGARARALRLRSGGQWRESGGRICWAVYVAIIGARSRGGLGAKKIWKIDPFSSRAREFLFVLTTERI